MVTKMVAAPFFYVKNILVSPAASARIGQDESERSVHQSHDTALLFGMFSIASRLNRLTRPASEPIETRGLI